MDSNPTRTTTPEDLEHANPYIRLPDHPTSAASPPYHREPIKSLVGIFLCMLFVSSMVASFFSNLESESLSKVNDDRSESSPSVVPKSLMPPSRGVPQGVSEKTFRDFAAAGPVYPWTNAMLSWQRTSYHFQPEKNWMNDPNERKKMKKEEGRRRRERRRRRRRTGGGFNYRGRRRRSRGRRRGRGRDCGDNDRAAETTIELPETTIRLRR